MRRNPKSYWKRLTKVKPNKIMALALTKNKQFRFIKLLNYIRRRELTDALEILAQSQIEGYLAIFVINNLQNLLRRAV